MRYILDNASNIVLIGLSATMKTSIGKELAARRGMPFYDSDEHFVENFGKIVEYFKKHGENEFRIEENKIISILSKRENTVIACGGGSVLVPAMHQMAASGLVIHLDASDETIFERVKKDKTRPFFCGARKFKQNAVWSEIARQREERQPLFDKFSDFTLSTDTETPESAAAALMPKIDAWFASRKQ